MARKIPRDSVIGRKIKEYIPCGEYAHIILDSGVKLEVSVDEDKPVAEPNHSLEIKQIFDLEDKLYDVTYVKEDKAKQKEYMTQLKTLKQLLIGKEYVFGGSFCTVQKVISTKNGTYALIDTNGIDRKVNLYSLEKRLY